jgi:hypothetical protein
MEVPNEASAIERCRRQPRRLVQAISDSGRIEQLSPSHFRLQLRPLQFMTLRLQPTVDMQVDK